MDRSLCLFEFMDEAILHTDLTAQIIIGLPIRPQIKSAIKFTALPLKNQCCLSQHGLQVIKLLAASSLILGKGLNFKPFYLQP